MAFGAIAQLVARFHGMEEVAGSIPASSTIVGSVELYFVRNELVLIYRFEGC